MKETKTTITKEYDCGGKLIKQTEVTEIHETNDTYVSPWYTLKPNKPYYGHTYYGDSIGTCGIGSTSKANK